ncbi:L,D-transpeptidase [Mycolicibacterium fortuitum]|uniref:L,D-transpeptidase n=1 Tax=Mycolicibacterium fortuitum TaxID=1766 RepID=UPI001AEF5CFE|nr:L,D-transpeptidase [Mycolicibacterium fortuitum]
MQHRTGYLWITAIAAAVMVTAATATGTSALAEPMGPPPPVEPAPDLAPPPMPWPAPFGQAADVGVPAGQNPLPFTGEAPFLPPTFNPTNGSTVGVAKPISITFQRPIADRKMAEDAIHVSSNPPVPGKFYWMSDTQVRWRPIDFWPAGTVVNVDAAGTKSTFRVGDSLVATIDDATHQMQIHRNGKLERTFPVSLGKPGYETPNGTYYVLEKFADIVMDSSTYGVPVNSAEGYKLKVKNALRLSNTGIFVHSAPWSVADQGKRNVSHGCPNLSPANAQWFFDHFGSGDPVVVKNSVGLYNQPDGAQDWQI